MVRGRQVHPDAGCEPGPHPCDQREMDWFAPNYLAGGVFDFMCLPASVVHA